MSELAKRLSGLLLLVLVCVACVAPSATPPGVRAVTVAPSPTPTLTPAPVDTATSAPTETSIPTATPIPTSTPIPTPTPEPTATTAPVPTDTPLPDPNPDVYAVVGVEMNDVLNVRTHPGVGHAIVGGIPPYGTGVRTFGQGVQVGASVWVLTRYNTNTGWVNSYYLARQVGQADDTAAIRATQILHALRDKDWRALAEFVHPDEGLRFSPYTFVRVDPDAEQKQDLVFDAAQVRGFSTDQAVYHWGTFDGTGEPIALTVDAYWSRFIYDTDFFHPHVVGYNEFIGRGNAINNIAQVYPSAVTVEYHLQGIEPEYEGMDWRSLRLVLEEKDGAWYLVGVIHDEWTI